MLDQEIWWQLETFRFLKGRSRSISLHGYRTEKPLVDEVPHRVLLDTAEKPEQSWSMVGKRGAEGRAPQVLPVLEDAASP